jgi:predicted DNA-binding transcriptional regulator AlpA
MPPQVLRPPEAAAYVALSPSTLAKMRIRGDGPPFIKLTPTAVGYALGDLDQWLIERRRNSTAPHRPAARLRPNERG